MTAPGSNEEAAAIAAVLEDWAEGIRTRDANRVLGQVTDDRIEFTLAPPLQYAGENAVGKEGLEAWFSTFQGPIGYQFRELSITAGGEAAYGHCLGCLSATPVGGEPFDLWFRLTLGFRRSGGRWLIAHAHESVPFYMDGSVRAAVDLAP